MRERPILFSAPMVRAILDGTKDQTRRVMPHQPPEVLPGYSPRVYWPARDRHMTSDPESAAYLQFERPGDYDGMNVMRGGFGFRCPYGQPGDRLWVRETWMDLQGTGIEVRTGDRSRYAYGADTPPGSYGDEARKDYGLKWRPSIHMPRAASRITLEVTGVRVERLKDISSEDCIAEGIDRSPSMALPGSHVWCDYRMPHDPAEWFSSPVCSFKSLWESINGAESWHANPWVWVVEFKRIEGAAA